MSSLPYHRPRGDLAHGAYAVLVRIDRKQSGSATLRKAKVKEKLQRQARLVKEVGLLLK